MRTKQPGAPKASSLAGLFSQAVWKAVIILIVVTLPQACKKEMKSSDPGSPSKEKERPLNMTSNLKAVDIKLIASDFVSPVGLVAVPDAQEDLL